MKIKNKATGKIMEITEKVWGRIRVSGSSRKYELVQERPEIVNIPIFDVDDTEEDQPTREEKIDYLRSAGITVGYNISDDKLDERYKQNIDV